MDKVLYSQSCSVSSSYIQMWELDYKEGWVPMNWCFQIVVLEKILEVPWIAKKSNQLILREINTKYSLEVLMLKLKLLYFGHLRWRRDSAKDPNAGKDWERKMGVTEDELFR